MQRAKKTIGQKKQSESSSSGSSSSMPAPRLEDPSDAYFDLDFEVEALLQEEFVILCGGEGDGDDASDAATEVTVVAVAAVPSVDREHVRTLLFIQAWFASLRVAGRFHSFASSPDSKVMKEFHPSLVLTSAVGIHDIAMPMFEVIVWDDVDLKIGRRTRIDGQYLNFALKPKPLEITYVDYLADVAEGKVQVLVPNMGCRMIRRSSEIQNINIYPVRGGSHYLGIF